jgi:hypothetical protein
VMKFVNFRVMFLCINLLLKVMCSYFVGGDEKVNVDPDDDSDWLHINYTLQSNDIDATTEVLTPGT